MASIFPENFSVVNARRRTTISNHDCCDYRNCMQISCTTGHRTSVQGALPRQMWKEVITNDWLFKVGRQQWHFQSRGTIAHIKQNMKEFRPQFITKQQYNSLTRVFNSYSLFLSPSIASVPNANCSISRSLFPVRSSVCCRCSS